MKVIWLYQCHFPNAFGKCSTIAAPFHFHKHLSDCAVCHPNMDNCSFQPVWMSSPGDSPMRMSFQLFCTSNLLQMFRPLVQHIFSMSNTSRKSEMYFSLFNPFYKHGNEEMCHAYCTLGASSMIMPGHHKLQCRVFRFHLENIACQGKREAQKKQHAWQPQLHQELPFSI